jgi:hypothetical protein
MSNDNKIKEEAQRRGGWVFQQINLFKDQIPLIKEYGEKHGLKKSEVHRLALDKLLKPEDDDKP